MKRIAFPAISCGVFGYPVPEAAELSMQASSQSRAFLCLYHFLIVLKHSPLPAL